MSHHDLNRDEDSPDRKIAYETVYKSLYDSIITGRFKPGKPLTIRGLAEEMNVSPMPVRESIRHLVALGALEMQTTRRVAVSEMTEERYREIVKVRILLEPEISVRAMAHCNNALINKLKHIDNEIESALDKGDADCYSLKNWEFHFTLYRAANCPIMLRLIESIWLQFGPFMRIIVGRLGTSYMVDQHINAITALKNKDEKALREAIRQDIYDGMDRIGEKLLGHASPK
ncbi:MAG: GntR family transcriptional regulator [Emcibacter sp.]|nr:GntR family transcriptional regulator [Emcibacter sp.]